MAYRRLANFALVKFGEKLTMNTLRRLGLLYRDLASAA
jgi:hypothetical protein